MNITQKKRASHQLVEFSSSIDIRVIHLTRQPRLQVSRSPFSRFCLAIFTSDNEFPTPNIHGKLNFPPCLRRLPPRNVCRLVACIVYLHHSSRGGYTHQRATGLNFDKVIRLSDSRPFPACCPRADSHDTGHR